MGHKCTEASPLLAPREASSVDVLRGVNGEDGDLSIPPQDRGWRAWRFLIGASLIESVTWGFPSCYGVFIDYFARSPRTPFSGDSSVSAVGVVANGCLQVSTLFLLQLLANRPAARKPAMWVGMALCVISSIGGAFAEEPWLFIASQGVLYGVGSGFLFAPTLSFMSEWFYQRRSFAYGIMFAWIGLTGTFLPTVYTMLLERYGHRVVLLGWAATVLFLIGTALLCVQPRVPSSFANPLAKTPNYAYLRKPFFWVLAIGTSLHGLVHYLPNQFMPSYATDIGLSTEQGAVLLSSLNLATCVGQPLFGLWVDNRGSFYLPMVTSTTLAGLSTLLIWGHAQSFLPLLLYVAIYGAISGGIQVLRSRFATAVVGRDDEASGLIVYGILTATRGVAMITSGFVGPVLVVEGEEVGAAYGVGKWRPLILFVGCVMSSVGLTAIARWLEHA